MTKTTTTPANLRNFKFGAFISLALIAIGCVTVNVNFPESAVQKASDDYVRDLYRSKEQGKATPKASATPSGTSALVLPQELFQWAVPSAMADDLKLNMASPKIDAIKAKMKANIGDIIDQKKAGVLGETNDGKLVIHDASKLKPLLKQKVDTVVRDDNSSRENLYAEVVSANNLPASTLNSVRKTFSRSFQAESPSGTWVQGEDGSWTQKH